MKRLRAIIESVRNVARCGIQPTVADTLTICAAASDALDVLDAFVAADKANNEDFNRLDNAAWAKLREFDA